MKQQLREGEIEEFCQDEMKNPSKREIGDVYRDGSQRIRTLKCDGKFFKDTRGGTFEERGR